MTSSLFFFQNWTDVCAFPYITMLGPTKVTKKVAENIICYQGFGHKNIIDNILCYQVGSQKDHREHHILIGWVTRKVTENISHEQRLGHEKGRREHYHQSGSQKDNREHHVLPRLVAKRDYRL